MVGDAEVTVGDAEVRVDSGQVRSGHSLTPGVSIGGALAM